MRSTVPDRIQYQQRVDNFPIFKKHPHVSSHCPSFRLSPQLTQIYRHIASCQLPDPMKCVFQTGKQAQGGKWCSHSHTVVSGRARVWATVLERTEGCVHHCFCVLCLLIHWHAVLTGTPGGGQGAPLLPLMRQSVKDWKGPFDSRPLFTTSFLLWESVVS